MQVTDVDDNGNRRVYTTSASRSPSPSRRSVSPSRRNALDNHAFVVLQEEANGNQRRKFDVPRSNLLDIPRSKAAGRRTDHHIRWMPPWYDAPTSI
ncbi:uncharacterized protein [Anabrus simplex]|uniref:uncharacterized protein n=1 Tax=Anabrus simplex TaxID=316456 RepID=UPI0035A2F13D